MINLDNFDKKSFYYYVTILWNIYRGTNSF